MWSPATEAAAILLFQVPDGLSAPPRVGAGIAWGDLGVGYFIIGLVLRLVAGRQDRVRKVPISDSYIATAF
jgi:hypothetical protein